MDAKANLEDGKQEQELVSRSPSMSPSASLEPEFDPVERTITSDTNLISVDVGLRTW